MTPYELVAQSSQMLLRARHDFLSAHTSHEHAEFNRLKLQAAIFSLDLCKEIAYIGAFPQTGFPLQASVKDLVHKIFEYDAAVSGRLISRLCRLAQKRGIQIGSTHFKQERKRAGAELKSIRKWATIRNAATGHYGEDIDEQFRLIGSIDPNEVLTIASRFLSFNMQYLKVLESVGREPQPDA